MAQKQGEVKTITKEAPPEFKGPGDEVKKAEKTEVEEVKTDENLTSTSPEVQEVKKVEKEEPKRTSVITMQDGKPTRIYFEDGKAVKSEEAKEK